MITPEFSLRFQSVWPLSVFLPKNLTVFPIRSSCKLDKPPMGMTLILWLNDLTTEKLATTTKAQILDVQTHAR